MPTSLPQPAGSGCVIGIPGPKRMLDAVAVVVVSSSGCHVVPGFPDHPYPDTLPPDPWKNDSCHP